jgi:hypothetical protein
MISANKLAWFFRSGNYLWGIVFGILAISQPLAIAIDVIENCHWVSAIGHFHFVVAIRTLSCIEICHLSPPLVTAIAIASGHCYWSFPLNFGRCHWALPLSIAIEHCH